MWDPTTFVGATRVSGTQRAALRDVEGCGIDGCSGASTARDVHVVEDYRAGDSTRTGDARIDLVLVSDISSTHGRRLSRDHDHTPKAEKPSDRAPS